MHRESSPDEPVAREQSEVATSQIRGSTLLMAGRGISLAINLAVQVLTVRFLSKLEYGSFAYALAMASMASRFSLLGMNRTASRWAAIYHERRDHARLFGSLLLMGGTILALGLGLVLGVVGLQGAIGRHVVSNPLSLTLLVTLIVLAPLNSLDSLLAAMFGVFSSPRLIFVRRHIVGPGLKLAAILSVIAAQGSVRLLALAYVAAGILGLVIGLTLLLRVLRDRDLTRHFDLKSLKLPVKEIFGFGLPMFQSDIAFVLRSSIVIFLLEFFHDSASVATYRAVLPVARLNSVVLESFGLLFIPAMARLAARHDMRGIDAAHGKSASWITLLSFPVFAVTFVLAQPLTVLLFGQRYADSAVILSWLAFGYFFNASLGLNALTLKACGKVRHILTIDFVAILVGVALQLTLIPRLGARGAAIGVCLTVIVHAVLNQLGLVLGAGLRLFPWKLIRVYAVSALSAWVLLEIQSRWSPPMLVSGLLAAAVWAALIALSRRQLEVGRTFPEVLRVPLIGRLIAGEKATEREGAQD